MVLYGALIIFFCFFYTSIIFNPEDTAENLRKYGGFLPGIRPGKRTAEYLDYVLTRLTVIGAAYITAVCLLPEFLDRALGGPVLFGRHLDPDRRLGDHGHGGADPVASAGAPVRRPDQEVQAARSGGEIARSEPDPVRTAGGRQGHTGQAPGRRSAAWSSCPPATCCAPPSRRGRSSARRSRRSWIGRAGLRRDRHRPDRGALPRGRGRPAPSSTASRARSPRPRRWTDRSPGAGRRSTR